MIKMICFGRERETQPQWKGSVDGVKCGWMDRVELKLLYHATASFVGGVLTMRCGVFILCQFDVQPVTVCLTTNRARIEFQSNPLPRDSSMTAPFENKIR